MKRTVLSCVTNITAHTHDKTVIFTACSDAPHKRSFRKNWSRNQMPHAGAFPKGNIQVRQLKRWNRNFREDAMRATKAVFFMHKDRPVAQLPIGAAPGKNRDCELV